jgi:hypothetical protein
MYTDEILTEVGDLLTKAAETGEKTASWMTSKQSWRPQPSHGMAIAHPTVPACRLIIAPNLEWLGQTANTLAKTSLTMDGHVGSAVIVLRLNAPRTARHGNNSIQ